jgi:hypothetical protein
MIRLGIVSKINCIFLLATWKNLKTRHDYWTTLNPLNLASIYLITDQLHIGEIY